MAASPKLQPALPDYFNWVDALRGIAALFVVIFHYHHFFIRNYQTRSDVPAFSDFPYASVLSGIYRHGDTAVELFWIISGFVFVHVYLNRKATAGQFWLARFARLYPLHFATLLLVASLQAINWSFQGTWLIYGNNDPRHFLLQLFLATNWSSLAWGLSFNGPIWSVSLEIGAYAMFFLSLRLLRKFRILAAAALCALCAYLWQADWVNPPLLRKGVLGCGMYFFCGCCTYFVLQYCRERIAALIVCIASLGLIFAVSMIQDLPQAVFLSTGFSGLILMTATLDITRAHSLGHRLRPLGDISYSLYLVHVPVQMVFLTGIDLMAPGYRGFAYEYWLMPLYLLTSCLLATLVYRFFELPAGYYLRQRFRRTNSKRVES